MTFKPVLFAIFLSIPVSVCAQKLAEEVYFACTNQSMESDDTKIQLQFLSSISYLDGLFDMYIMYNTVLGLKASCPPTEGISKEQLRLMFINYLQNNPNEMKESARSVVMNMISYYYPCSE